MKMVKPFIGDKPHICFILLQHLATHENGLTKDYIIKFRRNIYIFTLEFYSQAEVGYNPPQEQRSVPPEVPRRKKKKKENI